MGKTAVVTTSDAPSAMTTPTSGTTITFATTAYGVNASKRPHRDLHGGARADQLDQPIGETATFLQADGAKRRSKQRDAADARERHGE
jgi:hypothetical protein